MEYLILQKGVWRLQKICGNIGKFDPYLYFLEPEELENLTYQELVEVQRRRDEKYGKAERETMLGIEELKDKIDITETAVVCPVKCL